jgi:hypothetical protein
MHTDSHHEAPHVPFGKFFIFVAIQLGIAIGVFALVAPKAFSLEIHHPWGILLWTFLFGIPLSLFEYLYHRYLLHSAILPFMSAMHRAHSTHHGLTSVKAPVTPKEPSKLVPVSSEFPVEEEHQTESMMFPSYSISIFFAVFMILLGLPGKLIFPGQPVLLALIFAITIYYSMYEIWHMILHLPFERFWKPRTETGVLKPMFRRMYGFHVMHHWRPSSNQAIVGFWGVALWDYAFRTHRRPKRLPLDGAEVNYHDATLAKPLWPIALLDRWQTGLYKASRKSERFLARIFLGRRTEKKSS